MDLSRRSVLKAGLGLSASLSWQPQWLFAQAQPLIRKKIPSSGETIPIIGIGAARGRRPDAAARQRMEQFIDNV